MNYSLKIRVKFKKILIWKISFFSANSKRNAEEKFIKFEAKNCSKVYKKMSLGNKVNQCESKKNAEEKFYVEQIF